MGPRKCCIAEESVSALDTVFRDARSEILAKADFTEEMLPDDPILFIVCQVSAVNWLKCTKLQRLMGHINLPEQIEDNYFKNNWGFI